MKTAELSSCLGGREVEWPEIMPWSLSKLGPVRVGSLLPGGGRFSFKLSEFALPKLIQMEMSSMFKIHK